MGTCIVRMVLAQLDNITSPKNETSWLQILFFSKLDVRSEYYKKVHSIFKAGCHSDCENDRLPSNA